jgi:hypothetical protein
LAELRAKINETSLVDVVETDKIVSLDAETLEMQFALTLLLIPINPLIEIVLREPPAAPTKEPMRDLNG